MTSTQGHHGGWQNGPAGAGERRNGFGIAALVLGLAGAVLFWTVLGGIVLGLPALVLGVLGHRRGKRGVATNGTMSVIGAVIGALALVASSVLLAVGAAVFSSDEFKNYTECVEHADTEADRRQCAEDFDRDVDGR
ncbi:MULTISPECIES: DUF4190 domain-containing protein [unclassified Streptomyces]|uniref:DUF4190 domain-containing protein n=1 Tax=unclassified Streptomyces TaxID=2593676 RepID=UPI0005A6851B|nr:MULTISPECIES: DUF4190 domain-containing protein [unclassified Streptomyces]ODA71027.1 hypothetical protein APS67_004704 [Streptomyces sp. AVP053U2]